jgi:hypothetical protein
MFPASTSVSAASPAAASAGHARRPRRRPVRIATSSPPSVLYELAGALPRRRVPPGSPWPMASPTAAAYISGTDCEQDHDVDRDPFQLPAPAIEQEMEAVERVDCGVRRVVADTAQVIRAYHRAGHRAAGSQCAECCSLTPRPCTPDAGGATAHNVTRRAPNEARVAVPESAIGGSVSDWARRSTRRTGGSRRRRCGSTPISPLQMPCSGACPA